MKIYDIESILDFGKYKGFKISDVLEKEANYIMWCFRKIEWFGISSKLFINIPFIKESMEILAIGGDDKLQNLYQKLLDLHNEKIEIYNSKYKTNNNENPFTNDFYGNEDLEYDDRNWLEDASGTNDPETMDDVFWNLD